MEGDIIKIDNTAFDFGSNMESDAPKIFHNLNSYNKQAVPIQQITKMLDFSKPKNHNLGEPSSSQSKYNELNNYTSQKDTTGLPEMSLFNGRGILDLNYSSPPNIDLRHNLPNNPFKPKDELLLKQTGPIDKREKQRFPPKASKKQEQNFHSQLTFREDLVNGNPLQKDGLYLSGASNTVKGYYSTQTAFSKLEPTLKPIRKRNRSRSTSKSKSKQKNSNNLKHLEIIKKLIGGIQNTHTRRMCSTNERSVAEKLREHLLAKTGHFDSNHIEKSYRTPDISKQGTIGLSFQPTIGEKRRKNSRHKTNHQPIPIRNSGKKPKKHLKCTLNSVEEVTSRLRTRSTM
jgi:hypothetical protein